MKIDEKVNLQRYQIIDRITMLSESILVTKELIRTKTRSSKKDKRNRETVLALTIANLASSIEDLQNLIMTI